MSAGAINRGDVVRIRDRALGTLRVAHPGLSATDTLTVTRVDKSRGRKCLFLRKAGRMDPVLAWPEQVVVVSRAPVPAPRRKS